MLAKNTTNQQKCVLTAGRQAGRGPVAGTKYGSRIHSTKHGYRAARVRCGLVAGRKSLPTSVGENGRSAAHAGRGRIIVRCTAFVGRCLVAVPRVARVGHDYVVAIRAARGAGHLVAARGPPRA